MSKPVDVQAAGGLVARFVPYGELFKAGTTVPADGGTGYAPGCIFIDVDGAAGSQFFINEGTKASCDFNPLLLPGVGLSLTATAAELNTLHGQTMTVGAGAGFTDGVGAIYKNRVQLSGGIYTTQIMLDLTGTASSTTDLDIIGSGVSPAYIGQNLAAQQGTTILMGSMQCLEAPAGGVTDIDLYSATEATGKFDDAVTGLTETALVTSGGAWTNGLTKGFTTVPAASEYLYLAGGAAGTAATYTAGKFLITLYGF